MAWRRGKTGSPVRATKPTGSLDAGCRVVFLFGPSSLCRRGRTIEREARDDERQLSPALDEALRRRGGDDSGVVVDGNVYTARPSIGSFEAALMVIEQGRTGSMSCRRSLRKTVSATSVPLPLEWKSNLQFVATRHCNAFGAKLCQQFVQRAGKRSGGWRRRRGFKSPGHQLVDARLRMAIGDRLKRRLHPCIGIDAVQLACRNERSET